MWTPVNIEDGGLVCLAFCALKQPGVGTDVKDGSFDLLDLLGIYIMVEVISLLSR